MTMRQKHGLILEKMCSDNLHNFVKSPGYTDVDDGFYFIDHEEIPVSIKASKANGELCLGAMTRILQSDNNLLLIHGIRNNKKFDKIYGYFLPKGWKTIFSQRDEVNNICYLFVEYMSKKTNKDYLGRCYQPEIFHSRKYDTAWKENMKKFKQEYKELTGYTNDLFIYPRPKRDHKKQSRLQAAIPHNKLFCLEPYLIYVNESPYNPKAWDDFATNLNNRIYEKYRNI